MIVVGAVVGYFSVVGASILLVIFILACIMEFLIDISLITYLKENDPEQYLYYVFFPPYRIYYWIMHWRDLKGWVMIEWALFFPMIGNIVFLLMANAKHELGWFDWF